MEEAKQTANTEVDDIWRQYYIARHSCVRIKHAIIRFCACIFYFSTFLGQSARNVEKGEKMKNRWVVLWLLGTFAPLSVEVLMLKIELLDEKRSKKNDCEEIQSRTWRPLLIANDHRCKWPFSLAIWGISSTEWGPLMVVAGTHNHTIAMQKQIFSFL